MANDINIDLDINIDIEEILNFDYKLVNSIKVLEERNLGKKASINEWVIPVIIRYGKMVVAIKKEEKKEGTIKDSLEIVGVCELIKSWRDKGKAFIHSFYVDRNFRSKGIGKKLLSKVIEMLKAENIKGIELTVDPKNEVAINLYRSFGFGIVEYRKDEYGKGIDRYLMRLEWQ